jgi:RNA polymerase sigma-70 factor (ECF subfamily)
MWRRKQKYADVSDEQLYRQSTDGDELAFEMLYDRYATPLYRYFLKMLWNNRELAEDCVQDIFAKLARNPDYYHPDRSFKTWIFSVAHNRCKNEYRNHEVRQRKNEFIASETVQSESPFAVKSLDNQAFAAALQQALDSLPEDQRNTFVMRYNQDLSVKEIAGLLECSEGTVKSRLFYTLRKLGEQLRIYHPLYTEK